jgi:hypothetical protein
LIKDVEWVLHWFNLGEEGFVNEVQKRSGELLKELSLKHGGKRRDRKLGIIKPPCLHSRV